MNKSDRSKEQLMTGFPAADAYDGLGGHRHEGGATKVWQRRATQAVTCGAMPS